MVYIKEAHARDVWPISSSRYAHDGKEVQIDAPKCDEERCRLASNFKVDYKVSFRVLVDPVEVSTCNLPHLKSDNLADLFCRINSRRRIRLGRSVSTS